MSTVAIAPMLAIDGPLPRAPEYNLLTVAQRIAGRWEGGIVLWPFPEDLPTGIDPCLTGTFSVKGQATETEETARPEFSAFTAYLPIVCSAFVNDFEAIKLRADEGLAAMVHAVLEEQLVSGTFAGSQFLGDANVTDLNPAGAVAPQPALSHLEQAIGQTAKGGVIHADPATAAAWSFNGALKSNGRLETALGTPIVVGHGYIGATADSVVAGAGNSWAFASGPIQYAVSEQIALSDDVSEVLDRSMNEIVYLAEQDVVVGWDRQLQAAIRVDWTP